MGPGSPPCSRRWSDSSSQGREHAPPRQTRGRVSRSDRVCAPARGSRLALSVNVFDVVAMGRYGRGRWLKRLSRHDREVDDDCLARLEISDLAQRPIGELSGAATAVSLRALWLRNRTYSFSTSPSRGWMFPPGRPRWSCWPVSESIRSRCSCRLTISIWPPPASTRSSSSAGVWSARVLRPKSSVRSICRRRSGADGGRGWEGDLRRSVLRGRTVVVGWLTDPLALVFMQKALLASVGWSGVRGARLFRRPPLHGLPR